MLADDATESLGRVIDTIRKLGMEDAAMWGVDIYTIRKALEALQTLQDGFALGAELHTYVHEGSCCECRLMPPVGQTGDIVATRTDPVDAMDAAMKTRKTREETP